ncbi:MAG: SNF2-related protein [Chthoniobacterales bacterium]
MIALTERILNDAAGWQVMKMAKALLETNRVISAHYAPPILKGLVKEGNTEYRAGLKVTTATNIENLCSCRPSRDFGQICAHSIAVGLATIRPAPAAPTPIQPVEKVETRPFPFIEGSFTDPRWIELHLVLGPNFRAGLDKNEITIGVEAARGNQRTLVRALGFAEPWTCSKRDWAILRAIYDFCGTEPPGMLLCNRRQFGSILNAGKGFDRLTVARREKMIVNPNSIRRELMVNETSDDEITFKLDSQKSDYLLLDEGVQWSLSEMTWQAMEPLLPPAYQILFRQQVEIPSAAAETFRTRELPTLQNLFGVNEVSSITEVEKTAVPAFELTLEGSFNQLQLVLKVIYGNQVISYGSHSFITESHVVVDGKRLKRHHAAEQSIIESLKAAEFGAVDANCVMNLRGEHAVLRFLSTQLPHLQKKAEVQLGPRLKTLLGRAEVVRPKLEIQSSGENWFDLSVEMTSQVGSSYTGAEIQKLLNSGKTYEKRANGSVVLFDVGALSELQEVLRDCEPQQRQLGSYRIGKMHAGFLQSTLGEQLSGSPATLQKVDVSIPVELQGILRPYQTEGVQWMHFLAGNHLGGILADEMGLGKTLQTLAFLQSSGGRSLVVCPSSLVFNWEREAKKFTPTLRTLVIEGNQRAPLFAKINNADLVITSYALLRRDIARYEQLAFKSVILDEANHIKNPDTQNALAAQKIRADHRFALTGTPVENSVRDVWSLANFILPGYLGRRDDFKDRYEAPIQRGGAPEVQRRLANRLRPIMLRRLKKDVAKDLPERLEQVAWVDLSDSQKSVYRELLEQGRRKIEEASNEKNVGKSRMAALTALLRLRQACCDLRLLGLEKPEDASSKLEMLDELVQEAIDGGHRVLVFSQFVTMLKLIADRMTAAEIPFAYLDGSTRDRAGEVDKFQNSDTLPLFLISLKAGGVGLNLSAADTVIHFDPWWNPAVEAQATDRAHRIGQTRVVTSYKLIARNTVEEKILSLQQRKRDIIDATVESEEPTFGALSLDEIRDLMS